MFNYFVCIPWLLIIFFSIMAYKITKEKTSSTTAIIIAGLTFVVSVFVFSNILALFLNTRYYDIRSFYQYPVYLFLPYIAQ
jgi:hypothetical protein